MNDVSSTTPSQDIANVAVAHNGWVYGEDEVYYSVTASQLDFLRNKSTGFPLKISLICLGLSVALVKDFVFSIIVVYNSQKIELLDAISAFIFVGAAAAMISLYFAGRSDDRVVKAVWNEIKARRYQGN